MRLFTAIELPDSARRHLSDVQARLKRLWEPGALPPVSWTKESNLHVTLKFLGEVPDDRVPEVCNALARVRFPPAPLALRAEALDVFPSRGSVRVIHAKVGRDVEQLSALFSSVESQCAPIGFPRENRRFRGHVTMGRARAAARDVGVATGSNCRRVARSAVRGVAFLPRGEPAQPRRRGVHDAGDVLGFSLKRSCVGRRCVARMHPNNH